MLKPKHLITTFMLGLIYCGSAFGAIYQINNNSTDTIIYKTEPKEVMIPPQKHATITLHDPNTSNSPSSATFLMLKQNYANQANSLKKIKHFLQHESTSDDPGPWTKCGQAKFTLDEKGTFKITYTPVKECSCYKSQDSPDGFKYHVTDDGSIEITCDTKK